MQPSHGKLQHMHLQLGVYALTSQFAMALTRPALLPTCSGNGQSWPGSPGLPGHGTVLPYTWLGREGAHATQSAAALAAGRVWCQGCGEDGKAAGHAGRQPPCWCSSLTACGHTWLAARGQPGAGQSTGWRTCHTATSSRWEQRDGEGPRGSTGMHQREVLHLQFWPSWPPRTAQPLGSQACSS